MDNQNVILNSVPEIACADCTSILTADEVRDDYRNDDNVKICVSCNDDYCGCELCGDRIKTDDMTIIDNCFYCESCKDNNFGVCNHCENYINNDDLSRDRQGDGYCVLCRDNGYGDWNDDESDENESLIGRRITMTKKYQSRGYGKIIKSARGFAVEIECYCDDYATHNRIADNEIPDEVGMSHDGSLDSYGVEFQTPILKGDKGEQFLKDFCNTLTRNGYRVDKSCGLHIHLDGAQDFTNDGLKNSDKKYKRLLNFQRLFATYYILDDILAMYLPLSRRENTFCKRLGNDYNLSEIMNATTQEKFEQIWYRCDDLNRIDEIKKSKSHGSRYHGVNMHCLLWDNHLEIRYHSGTIDKNKILFWIELNQAIMRYSVSRFFELSELKRIQALANGATKRAEMYRLLQLEGDIVGYFEARAKKFCTNELSPEVVETK